MQVAKSKPPTRAVPRPEPDCLADRQRPVDRVEHQTVRLSVRMAAARAGNSPRTVKRWIAAGYLPATRSPSPKGKGHLRIRLGDLESLIARGALN